MTSQNEQQASNLQGHLPECECYGRNHGECSLCICNRLRACEQRVLTQFVERIQDRMTDSDLDNVVSDDGKDLIWAAIDALRDQPADQTRYNLPDAP